MSRTRFVMKCLSCSAPVADSQRCCPYCLKPLRTDTLGAGTRSTKHGHLVVDGAHVAVGADAGEVRTCPFCGAPSDAAAKHCQHCNAKLVIETLYLRSLVIEKGGSMSISLGGKVVIGRPDPAPKLSAAAARGELDGVKARINAGDELDAVDSTNKTPLLLALENRHVDVARHLIAMGASLADADDAGTTPLHAAAKLGHAALVEVLLAEGAAQNVKNRARQTPADVAQEAEHRELALRLRA